MGLHVSVYRDADGRDCTNNGISSRYTTLCIVNADGPFEPNASHPAAILVRGNLERTAHIVPVIIDKYGNPQMADDKRLGPMFGGNFAYSSDSRFHRAVERIAGITGPFYGAVPIHDRFE